MVKISIIVPVYNVEKYIVRCIESLVSQTFTEIEILIINDETKDKSIELIKKNFNDKRIKIYNKKNGGAASARNFALSKVSGNYIFYVDGDDFLDINCLEEMYNIAIKNDLDLVICDYYKYISDDNKEHISMIKFYDKDNTKSTVTAMPGPVGKLIKKEILIDNNIKFLENHLFEDNAIMPFVCALAKKSVYINKPYYFYVQHDGSSLNQTKYNPKWEDIFDSLENLYDKFESNNMLGEYYSEIEYIYIEYLLHAAGLRFLNYKEARYNLIKIKKIIKNKFRNWRKNKYYKKESIKYKIMVNLIYHNQVFLINLLRR